VCEGEAECVRERVCVCVCVIILLVLHYLAIFVLLLKVSDKNFFKDLWPLHDRKVYSVTANFSALCYWSLAFYSHYFVLIMMMLFIEGTHDLKKCLVSKTIYKCSLPYDP
jgi:hypothetical protein